jgi:D-alanyl-lipoteichoic acid acyltransferase DltB (MBOAT superfamily)
MVFNSLTFLVFLAVVLVLYYRLSQRGQNLMLLAASYVFYGWWDYRFLSLLLFTSLFDYACALKIDGETRPGRRKLFVASSIFVNLGVLGIFKYYNFFASSLKSILDVMGMQPDFPTLHWILPIGLSFYTFLSMSYTIDVYRKEIPATRHPLDFMLYVAYFPHLVAGPIVRASYLLPQVQRRRVIHAAEVENGIWLILMGYIKKMVIADRLAQFVDWSFAQPAAPFGNVNTWVVIYAFAFQIYGDFAGYSDIARGLAKLMGFELVVNFRAPYLVTNPAAFWRNWHISLSTWLRDYLYIPLGGNRLGSWKTYRNLMLTMLLGGLWHGAGVAFILWGLFHGLLLSIHRFWSELRGLPAHNADPQAGGWVGRLKLFVFAVVFFHVTCLGWLLFRAGGLRNGVSQWGIVRSYLHAMFNFRGTHLLLNFIVPVAMLGALALFFQWRNEKMNEFSQWPVSNKAFAVTTALALITVMGVFQGTQFIYFQF